MFLISVKTVTGSGHSRGCGISDFFNLKKLELESLKNKNQSVSGKYEQLMFLEQLCFISHTLALLKSQ